ncbi:MAG TPA: TonB-dependent receptor [Sphingomicrobium sp.]|nr:TonB-dependent receptor [Sphingomicrobium sp.]
MSLILLAATAAAASDEPQPAPIVVTAERPPSRALPPVVTIDGEELLVLQPDSAADAVRELPGVSVRVNSRGEAIVRVRGSEERQTQVFLDGAPLAVPWDGRADIGVLPAGLIGSVSATKGAVPIEYGANAVAGVIDLRTRSGDERGIDASARIGSLGFVDSSAVATIPVRDLGFTFAAAAMSRDAEPVASLEALPFSQPRSRRRLNTDLDSMSLFGAAQLERGPVLLRASLLHFEAARGIAPESDRDPAETAPRYWRYPDIAQTQLNLGSEIDLSQGAALRLVGWRQWFSQTIQQYQDQTYSTLSAREDDEDDTVGGRAVLTAEAGPMTIRIVGTAQTSRHAQRDTPLPSGPEGPKLVYRQNLYTLGGEVDAPLGPGRASAGLAYDRSTNPLTGDKLSQPGRGALAFSAAYRLPLGNDWILTLSGGRRNRFPSARELFGEALGRFLPNPALKPEQAWLGDVELRYETGRVSAVLNPFVARVEDTIAQRVVTVDGRNLRQRYNLSGSTSIGVDAAASWQVSDRLGLALEAALLRARADSGTAPFRRLPQRPSYEITAAADFAATARLTLRGELRRVGPAVDLGPDGEKTRLAPGNELNLRARWRVGALPGGPRLFLVGSVENLLDDVITPQLGLPLPGRAFRFGFQFD